MFRLATTRRSSTSLFLSTGPSPIALPALSVLGKKAPLRNFKGCLSNTNYLSKRTIANMASATTAVPPVRDPDAPSSTSSAAAQVKKALEVALELGGHGYYWIHILNF